MKRPRFELGRVLMTPGAVEAMQAAKTKPSVILTRHVTGDWGDLDNGDKALNDKACKPGLDPLRVFSAYKLTPEHTVWVITEGSHTETTILLPSEY